MHGFLIKSAFRQTAVLIARFASLQNNFFCLSANAGNLWARGILQRNIIKSRISELFKQSPSNNPIKVSLRHLARNFPSANRSCVCPTCFSANDEWTRIERKRKVVKIAAVSTRTALAMAQSSSPKGHFNRTAEHPLTVAREVIPE